MSLESSQLQKTVLTMSLALIMVACGDETTPVYVSPAEVTVNNPAPLPATNTAPVAQITAKLPAENQNRVQLSAIDSTDPDGDALVQFLWQVTKAPKGSYLQDTVFNATEAPGLTNIIADKTGDYEIELRVYDGKIWSTPVRQAVSLVNNSLQNSGYVLNRYTRYYSATSAQVLSLTADKTSGERIECEVTGKPIGSRVVSASTDTQTCGLTPDKIGDYEVTARVYPQQEANNYDLYTFSVNTSTYSAPQALPYTPSVAQYSATLKQIVMLDQSASLLHLYDTSTKKSTAVGLPLIGSSLKLSADGLFALVLHDGRLSYIDLTQKKRIKTINLNSTKQYAKDVLWIAPNTALLLEKAILRGNGSYDPMTGQWIYDASLNYAIVSIDTGKSQIKSLKTNGLGSSDSIENLQFLQQGSVMLAHFHESLWSVKLESDTLQLTPVSPSRNLLSCNGDYYYSYAPLFLATDGERVFNGCGAGYRLNSNKSLNYAGQLTNNIKTIDMNKTINRLLISSSQGIFEYGASFLNLQRTLPLPLIPSTDHQQRYSASAKAAYYLNDQGQHVVLLQVEPVMGTNNEYAVAFSQ